MKHIIVILLIVLSSAMSLSAQEHLSKQEVSLYSQMTLDAAGTFQIQMINTRELPTIPLSIIKTIEEKRDAEDVVYYQYSNKMRIMILPTNEIKSSEFISLERIKYISL
jgi:hypothetical protein